MCKCHGYCHAIKILYTYIPESNSDGILLRILQQAGLTSCLRKKRCQENASSIVKEKVTSAAPSLNTLTW